MGNWDGRLGVFDLETTGVDVDTSRIVTACVAVLEADGRVVARWDWIADPGIPIPADSVAVHGITDERVIAEGRPAGDVIAEIRQAVLMLQGLGVPIAVYNAPYDLTVLDRECRRHHLPVLDPPSLVVDALVLDRALDPRRPGKRTLATTAAHYGVADADGHDADNALVAGRLAQAIARAFPSELEAAWPDLHRRQEAWYADQAELFQSRVRETKGDEHYVANAVWPVKPIEFPTVVEDTEPFPGPPLRPSATVPMFDVTDAIPLAIDAPRTEFVAPPVREAEHVAVETDREEHDVPTLDPLPPAPVTPAPGGRAMHVAAAIITDSSGRSLVVRRHDSDAFMQPGGKIERGESALAALIRELGEELGLSVDTSLTEFLGSYEAPALDELGTAVRAEVFALTTDGPLRPGAEIAEIAWLASPDEVSVALEPLTQDVLLPLWASREVAKTQNPGT